MQKECLPSEIIADFLNHITAWRDEHKEAFEGVGKEERYCSGSTMEKKR